MHEIKNSGSDWENATWFDYRQHEALPVFDRVTTEDGQRQVERVTIEHDNWAIEATRAFLDAFLVLLC